MSGPKGQPDWGRLQQAAAHRRRWAVWVGAGGTAAVVLVVDLLAYLVIDAWSVRAALVVAGLTVAVVLLMVLGVHGTERWQPPAPIAGADETTLRAVHEALRRGTSDDPRIDALARDTAMRNLRITWQLWAYAAFVPLALVAVAINASDGKWFLAVLWTLLAALFSHNVWQQTRARRRARRYLHTPARPKRAD